MDESKIQFNVPLSDYYFQVGIVLFLQQNFHVLIRVEQQDITTK